MFKQATRGRTLRVAVAAVAASTLAVLGSFGVAPSGADPVTKTLTGSCGGADDASTALLNALGGNLTVPFEVTADVPPTLEPEQSGSPISFTWKVSLSTDVVDKAVVVDPVLTVSNLVLDMGVSGPTATTVVQGRPGPLDVALTAGQPAEIVQGPFSGTLEEVGKGGLIRYSPSAISFTISVDLSGQARDINVVCAASGTVATTSIKIPGSPEIVQPIALSAQPGETLSVDVLGQYVTNGIDDDGKELPVDPSSLKVIDGPATVAGGQVQITAGGPGSTTSATFEVCAGTLPGIDEVQRITIDPSNDAMRRSVGFSLTYGDAETAPVWLARKWKEFPEEGGSLIGNLFNAIFVGLLSEHQDIGGTYPETYPLPVDWRAESFAYFFTDRFEPTPELIDAALETLPGIGAGGVEVTGVEGEPFTFDITFVGANGQQDVESIGLGDYYSILPRETLTFILEQAQGLLGGGGEGEEPTTTLPEGMTLQQYADQLRDELNAAVLAGDLTLAGEKLNALVAILPDLLISNIDVDAVIAFITGLFPSPPTLVTTVSGEEPTPICSQGVIDVNVLAVEGAVAVAPSAGVAGTGTAVAGRIAFAG